MHLAQQELDSICTIIVSGQKGGETDAGLCQRPARRYPQALVRASHLNKTVAVVVWHICYCELQLNACASDELQRSVLISYQAPNSSLAVCSLHQLILPYSRYLQAESG